MTSETSSASPTGPSSVEPVQPDAADVRPAHGLAQQAKAGEPLSPGLYIVSTPIGNLRDITLRALDTLSGATEVLAEDTRQARKLFDAFGLSTRLSPYHDHNGAQRRPELIDRLQQGEALALISDAGTPLVSDPGFKLVREAIEAGVSVIPIPGASAVLAALVVAGLPSDRFLFAGFAPSKSAQRKAFFADLGAISGSVIVYETGPRLSASLADLSQTLGAETPVVVTRELTKRFEEVRRGRAAELAEHYAEAGPPRGEIALVLAPEKHAASAEAVDDRLITTLATMGVKQASAAVAAEFGLPKRDVYQRALALKADDR